MLFALKGMLRNQTTPKGETRVSRILWLVEYETKSTCRRTTWVFFSLGFFCEKGLGLLDRKRLDSLSGTPAPRGSKSRDLGVLRGVGFSLWAWEKHERYPPPRPEYTPNICRESPCSKKSTCGYFQTGLCLCCEISIKATSSSPASSREKQLLNPNTMA